MDFIDSNRSGLARYTFVGSLPGPGLKGPRTEPAPGGAGAGRAPHPGVPGRERRTTRPRSSGRGGASGTGRGREAG
jgi:hypothetical protein